MNNCYKELQPNHDQNEFCRKQISAILSNGFIWVIFALFLLTRPLPISRAIDIDGTTGPDTITGTVNDDDIRGRSGVDVINGLEGNDEIQGQQGNDIIN